MPIPTEQKQHCAALIDLFESFQEFKGIFYNLQNGYSRGSYILNFKDSSNNKALSVGLFIKTSNKRLSPWNFTFKKIHQEEILDLINQCDQVFVILVAGNDGFALLSYEKLKKLLDDTFEETEWVSVSRKHRQNYRVSGKDGKLKNTLPLNAFPLNIKEYVRDYFSISD